MKKKFLILVSLFFCLTLTACGNKQGTSYTKEQQTVIAFLDNVKKGKYENASNYVENPSDFMNLVNLRLFENTNVELNYLDKRPLVEYQIEQEEVESEDKKGKVLFLTMVINNYSDAGKNFLYALNQDVDTTNVSKEIEKGFKEGKLLKVTKIPVELVKREDGNYLIKLDEVKLAGIETTMSNYIFFNNAMFNRILSGYAGAIDEVLNEEIPDLEDNKQNEEGSYDVDYFDKLIEEKDKNEENTIKDSSETNKEKTESTDSNNKNKGQTKDEQKPVEKNTSSDSVEEEKFEVEN
ncbi:lipoprotein [Peptoniphilus sp.]|uniref:LptM family lipoprotein n=1 Tax=Peptoniphilus sp. TaxID=1971214 RepID=UPI003991A747